MLSQAAFLRAKRVIPGGVNSPVRSFNAVGGCPRFIAKAHGPFIEDIDGQQYIDFVGSWGPMIVGHTHPKVVKAIQEQAALGCSYGAPCELETELAELICKHMPSMEKIRFVSSGTEACMTALRLARGYTGRDKIIKFEGCYHGHSDSLLVKAGSGCLTFGTPSSPGVPKGCTENTLTLSFNDVEQLHSVFKAQGHDIAAVILEPIAGNMNMIFPTAEFLSTLRKLCTDYGAVLIFDEVMTGFRVALGGAAALYGIQPDMTTLSKVIGGGLPVGAFGGKREIMSRLSPEGPVYQAGTLSGNPIAMRAGIETLKLLEAPGTFESLHEKSTYLMQGLKKRADQAHIPLLVHAQGGMFGFFFTDQLKISSFADAMRCNEAHFLKFFHGMLERGVYLPASRFEAGFISTSHTQAVLDQTLAEAETVLEEMQEMQERQV
ncbi:MAG: glutamate-1-semialdehyde-2,1-aminomutase [Gammaproteobacteria bacterium]|nr:glutamate-1-semialdehyde-2,1-aminomutase [Gammaproteobacteria bacterium]